jgi:hypothetical protein
MGWTKFFLDGQQIHEPESWSRTRLDNIAGVELVHGDKKIGIYGEGQYWQSDTFQADVVLGEAPQKLVARRIEFFVDNLKKIKIDRTETSIVCSLKDNLDVFNNGVQEAFWLILEIDTINNTIESYTSKERI